MKNIFKSIKILVIFMLLASCSESYLDVNDDPNNPVTVSPDLVLPVALNYTATIEERDRGQNHLGNMFMANWSQSDGFSWYNDEFLYLVTSSFYQRFFDYVYLNPLKQYQVLEDLEGDEFGYYKAIAKIMKSLHFQILVDCYGDIPYSEALERGGNPTPAYDDAQTVYEGLITDLTAAIALINATANNADISPVAPGNDDGIFGGDMDMWKSFANTIKLRILVRQSDMSGRAGYIQQEFNVIAAEGSGFMNSDVTINIGYNQTENQQNPKWNGFGQDVSGSNTLTNDATCATPYILDKLMDTNDGRLNFFFEEPSGGHLGVVQGLQQYDEPIVDQYVPANVSNIGPGILKSPSQDAVIYTAAESYFNRAEAAMKGFISSSPQAMYEAGIQASFSYLGAGDATSYYSQNIPNVGWAASTNKMEAIISQKATALMGVNALQSWFDYNRTGYPSNVPVSLLATTSDRPVRLFYPASELTSNSDNVPSQSNAFSDKIFWAN
ncbi:MAG: SusD/RagB family nutrient-binding outer membrane lipoprotein [Flaviramulus sp.]|nr:SusD/RagB family nutrient-binding outer membrane lipoprotein [Flaviramulus sp.]NNC51341.1 SusD/RagB family nutrient-binding outer membrane lipoprotein [Flaviramulus sp.]